MSLNTLFLLLQASMYLWNPCRQCPSVACTPDVHVSASSIEPRLQGHKGAGQ